MKVIKIDKKGAFYRPMYYKTALIPNCITANSEISIRNRNRLAYEAENGCVGVIFDFKQDGHLSFQNKCSKI